MTDRELLELAAKAAGIDGEWKVWIGKQMERKEGFVSKSNRKEWTPLTDDGDALRLAVKLNMLVDCFSECARTLPDILPWSYPETDKGDRYAATRRAIVRAAAEIGKTR
jgi:hypothetical protein